MEKTRVKGDMVVVREAGFGVVWEERGALLWLVVISSRTEAVTLAVAERHISRTSLPLRVCLDRPIAVGSGDQVNASVPLPTP